MSAPNPYDPGALAKLLFRRQFLMGPKPIEGLPDWKRTDIAGTYHLATHPDLGVQQASDGCRSVTLLGYILDPHNPDRSDADIVTALLGESSNIDLLIAATSPLGGRWVLIVCEGTETILIHDAGGMRQVCYSRSDSVTARNGWCASQPGLLAEKFSLAEDQEAVGFVEARDTWEYLIHWLPGDTSLYEDIKFLLPNHSLNLSTGAVRRYWPNAALGSIEPRRALEESSRLMRGLMEAARRRFGMALSLTAGWDSRIMLALSKECFHELYFFTLWYPHFTRDTADIAIPAALLTKLGGAHSIIPGVERGHREFEAIYARSSASRGRVGCGHAQALYETYPQERVCISGDVAEIVKCYIRPPGVDGKPVSAELLATFDEMGSHPFVLRAYDKWLSGVTRHNVDLLDLFCWEQMAGRVQAAHRSDLDIVQECFAPFNCRSLLATMLSVDEAHRKRPEFSLLRDLLVDLWPETLSEPINPPRRVGVREAVVRTLVRWHLWQLIPRPMIRLGKRAVRMARPGRNKSTSTR